MRPIHASFLAALMLSTTPAFAGPADDFVGELQALAEKNGVSVAVENSQDSGDGFVLENMTVTGKQATGIIAETTVTGYARTPTGGSADRVTSKGVAVSIASNDMTITVDEIDTTDLNFPENGLSTPSMFSLYSSQTFANMVVKAAGLTIVEVANSQVKTDKGADGVYTSSTAVSGIVIDLANLPTAPQSGAVAELGYERLNASIEGTATYDPAEGTIESTNTQMVVENAATVGVSYRITGYTEQFAEQMAAWSKTYGEESRSPEAMMALMPMLSNVKVASMMLKLTDDSLTGKLLDMQAKQMGTTGEQLAQSAPMFLGMGLSQLQMPELTQMVTQAIGGFLQNPGTLTIAIEPAEPVSVAAIAALSQSDPKALPELLNLSVTASN